MATYLDTKTFLPDLGTLQILNEKGELDIDYISRQEAIQKGIGPIQFPSTSKADTMAGGMVRGISQFLTGFAPAAKVLKVTQAGTKGAKIGKAVGAAAVSDFAFFDPHEERLADLIESNPELSNPITKFLQADPTDSSLEGRFKNVLEGFGLDAALAGAFTVGLKAVRAGRKVGKMEKEEVKQQVDAVAKEEKVKIKHPEDEPAVDIYQSEGKELIVDKAEREVGKEAQGIFDIELKTKDKAFNVNLAKVESPEQIKEIITKTSELFEPQKAIARPEGFEQFIDLAKNVESVDDFVKSVRDIKDVEQDVIDFFDKSYAGEGKSIQQASEAFLKDVKDGKYDELAPARIDPKNRGVQTNEQTKALAADLNMSVDDLLARKQGQAFNAEQAVAARNLMVSSADNLMKIAKKVQSLEATDADRLMLRKAMNVHVAIQREVGGLTAEAGRALQAFNIQAKSQREQIRAINDLLDSSGGRKRADEIAETLNKLSESGADNARLNKQIDKLHNATTFDMVYEVWVNSILSGPITHLVNINSNALTALGRVPERALAAGIGKITRSADAAQFGEVGAQMYGFLEGLRDGWRMAKESFKSEGSVDPLTKLEQRQFKSITSGQMAETTMGKAINTPLKVLGAKTLEEGGIAARFVDAFGTVARFPGRMLNSEDAFFKGINYRMELRAQAYRQATHEGLNGKELARRVTELVENPNDSIRIKAMDEAHNNTFTNVNKFARGLSNATSNVPVMKFVIPFTNTPSNIVKYAFERTPLAPLGRQFREDILAGGARRDEALAKIAMGSSVMTTVTYLASQGVITGSAPSNWALANIKNKVVPPNSIKIWGKYYSYRRTDPVGILIGMAADMYYISEEADQTDVESLAAMTTTAIANNVISKTWMTGFSDFVEVLSSSEKSDGTASRKFTNYIDNLKASFFPNFARQVNVNLVDPYMREADDAVQKVLTKIPGFSDKLPLRRDIWGEPRMYNLIEEASDDPLNVVLVNKRVGISMPGRVISHAGGETRLTGEEYSRYMELSRKPAKKHLDRLADRFESMDKVQIEDAVRDVLRRHQKIGKAKLLQEYPEIIDRIQEEQEL